jgi:DNA repair protein RadC
MKSINFYTVKQVKERIKTYKGVENRINEPHDAYRLCKELLELDESPNEKFAIFALNTKNEIVGVHVVHQGTLNSSIVHPRDVFQRAILNNAASIICFHNHPSGDPTPTKEDVDVTRRLVKAGEILGIQVLDHIIVGEERFISLKEKGYII